MSKNETHNSSMKPKQIYLLPGSSIFVAYSWMSVYLAPHIFTESHPHTPIPKVLWPRTFRTQQNREKQIERSVFVDTDTAMFQ